MNMSGHMPTLHLNGSGYKNLSTNYHDMVLALHNAVEKMAQSTPHERDYYTNPGSFDQALKVHYDRMKAVQTVLDSINDDYVALIQQNSGR